jgi:hypothetical protein
MARPVLALLFLFLALFSYSQNQPVLQPVITLERTACLGSCPVYKLSIYPDGSVVYDGKEYVRVKEVQHYQIGAAAVQELIAKFQAAHYFSFAPAYNHITMPDGTEMSVTDMPTTYTSLSLDGRTKKVENYVGAPQELRQLEDEVDRLARTSRFIRIDADTIREKAKQGWKIRENEATQLLFDVVRWDDIDAVRAFLQEGADANAKLGEQSLLHVANSGEMVRVLIAAGTEVNVKSSIYGTPLLMAAREDDIDALTALLSAGAHVNEPNSEGETPLMKAAYEGNTENCRLLLSSGADIHARDNSGRNALDQARAGRLEKEKRKDDPFSVPPDPAAYQATEQLLITAGAKDGQVHKK